MFYKIEIQDKPGIFDASGESVRRGIVDLGIEAIRSVRFIQVYNIEGDISEDDIIRITRELLTDRICQDYFINRQSANRQTGKLNLLSR